MILRRAIAAVVIMIFLANKYSCSADISFGPISAIKEKIKELSGKVDKKLDGIFTTVQTDALGDYGDPGGGEPPAGVYPFGPVDLVEINAGANDRYFYLKFVVAAPFPEEVPDALDGTKIIGMGINMSLDIDRDEDTGCPVYDGAEVLVGFHLIMEYDKVELDPVYFSKATGLDEPEESRFAGIGTGEVVRGGKGYNFVTLRFELSDLGLEKGMIIDVKSCSAEAESEMWHHYSFDDADRFTIVLD